MITQSLRQVATEIVELPTYEELPHLPEFLVDFEDKVSQPWRLLVLDEALKATPARWWETHKKSIDGWLLCRRLMEVRLSGTKKYEKYDGRNDPNDHSIVCHSMWLSQ